MGVRYLTIGEQRVLNPRVQYESAVRLGTPLDFWQRANSYSCPLGSEPGSAWLLMSRMAVDYLDVNAWHELKWQSEYDTLVIPKLVMTRATCMNKDGDSKGCYLVEFRDKRHVLQMTAVARQYNLRLPDYEITEDQTYYEETLDDDGGGGLIPWTWQRVLEDLWEELPADLAGEAPDLPYEPEGAPEELQYFGAEWSAWSAIGDLLAACGCTIKYDPIEDTFSVVKMGTTQSGLSATLESLKTRLVYDYKPKQNLALATLPATIRVLFPRQRDPRRDRWEIALPYEEDIPTGASGAAEGTIVAVWDDTIAQTNENGDVTNTAELSARANEVAQNWFNRAEKSFERNRRHYSGIGKLILPGSEVSEVAWRDYGDQLGLVTEVRQFPAEHKRAMKERMRPIMMLRGITVDAISHGSPGTVKLVKKTASGYELMTDVEEAELTVEADFYLGNTGDSIAANHAVTVLRFPDGSYEIVNAWCDERNWTLAGEEEE